MSIILFVLGTVIAVYIAKNLLSDAKGLLSVIIPIGLGLLGIYLLFQMAMFIFPLLVGIFSGIFDSFGSIVQSANRYSIITAVIIHIIYFLFAYFVLFVLVYMVANVLAERKILHSLVPIFVFLVGLAYNSGLTRSDISLLPLIAISISIVVAYARVLLRCYAVMRGVGMPEFILLDLREGYTYLSISVLMVGLGIMGLPTFIYPNSYLYFAAYLPLLATSSLFKKYYVMTQHFRSYIESRKIFTASEFLLEAVGDDAVRKEYATDALAGLTQCGYIRIVDAPDPIYISKSLYRMIQKQVKGPASAEQAYTLVLETFHLDISVSTWHDLVQALCLIELPIFDEQQRRPNDGYSIGPISNFIGQPMAQYLSTPQERAMMLMRYTISGTPIVRASKEYRSAYYHAMEGLLQELLPDEIKIQFLGMVLAQYKQIFQLDSTDIAPSKQRLDHAFELLSKGERVGKCFGRAVCLQHKYTFVVEVFYFALLLTNQIKEEKLVETLTALKFKKREHLCVHDYLQSIATLDFSAEKNLSMALYPSKGTDILCSVERNIITSLRYPQLERYNVTVCATMSAGKSTFINALLGYDYIPSRNQVCTAKITSIADNDYLSKIIGTCEYSQSPPTWNSNVQPETLEKWNDSVAITRVQLEGDLEGISSLTRVLVVHDTPGPNYSGNESHRAITMDFLQNSNTDMILYLLNAEHVATTDNALFLQSIQQDIVTPSKTKIIFMVNKLDSFDTELGDDIQSCLNDVRKELVSFQFPEPEIIPISAYAAKLFKMVLHGMELSRRESVDFENLFTQFCSEGQNLLDYVDQYHFSPTQTRSQKQYIVREMEFTEQQLLTALDHTGIPLISSILDRQVQILGE